jgi:uncharacterized metal-binding protein
MQRYGIPVLNGRVAPRATCADSLLLAVHRRRAVRAEPSVAFTNHNLLELAKVLADRRVDVLVCGGISFDERMFLTARQINIIDNVVGSPESVLAAIEAGTLRPGFGLDKSHENGPSRRSEIEVPRQQAAPAVRSDVAAPADCLACRDRVCLHGRTCDAMRDAATPGRCELAIDPLVEAALDICFEDERTLCRLSELIYFCLEMRYQRIGLAYCVDLEEAADTVTRVLRRFFVVYPICCKVGGILPPEAAPDMRTANDRVKGGYVACNPAGQAQILNRLETDFNVVVGLCMGADCVFTRQSDAPVTTLFVKDKSLANNPIGAVYSEYYLTEAMEAARSGGRTER